MERDPDILDRASTVPDLEPTADAQLDSIELSQPSSKISEPLKSGGLDVSSETSAVDALENDLLALHLEDRPPDTMFRSLSSIFQAARVQGSHTGPSTNSESTELWGILKHAEELEASGSRDVGSLIAVKRAFEQRLWNDPKLLLLAVKIVADASRDESWRLPIGQSGMMEFGLGIVSNARGADELQEQALRLVGNSCADTDENRARLVADHQLGAIMHCIGAPRFARVAVPVMYNICFEYEPAQKEAVNGGIFNVLVKALDAGVLDSSDPAFGYLCRLIDLGLEHLDIERSPDNAVEVLLRTATQPNLEIDDMTSLVDAAVAHLQLEKFQQHMLDQELFGLPLRFLIRSYFPQANITGAKIPPISGAINSSREPGEEAELSRVRKALIQALSDVSALPDFQSKHSQLNTPLIETVMKWLSASLPQIQLCACILLGNLARSDEVCRVMVTQFAIHRDTIAILRTSTDTSVLHSALGYLRNLALPRENKSALGDAGLMDALTRFWGSDFMPQVSHASASVARQLIINNLANVERLLTPLSADEDSPAHDRTYLTLLLALFEKSDELAVKIEIARTTASVLRSIHTPGSGEETLRKELQRRLYSRHPDVGLPLGTMVSQARYPVIRSEGWFAMALMARNSEGAVIISSVMSDVKVFTALEEAIRGTSVEPESSSSATPVTDPSTPFSPNTQATSNEMMTKDRDNAMILVSELLKHRAEDLASSIRRSALQELLQDGARSAREE